MPSTLTRPARRAPIEDGEASTKAAVAGLSPMEIRRMTNDELVRAIRAVRMPFLNDSALDHLQYLDRPALERLVYLARRTCRNQGY